MKPARLCYFSAVMVAALQATPVFADPHQVLSTYLDTGDPNIILHKGKTLLGSTTVTCPSNVACCTFALHATDTVCRTGSIIWKIVITVDGAIIDGGTPQTGSGSIRRCSTGYASHIDGVAPGDHVVNLYSYIPGDFDSIQGRWVSEYTVTTP